MDSRKGAVPKKRNPLSSSKEGLQGDATDCLHNNRCCSGSHSCVKPLDLVSQIEDDDHMAAEAATLHPGSRCEVNPGGKRGLIRQE